MKPPKPPKKLKIGLVVDDTLDKPDGVQQYVLTIGAWLVAQGHQVQYLAGATTRQDVGTIHSLSKNVAVTFNGNRLTIPLSASTKRIAALLQTEQFDVLHIQMPYSPMLAHKIITQAPPRTAIIGTFHILPQTTLVRLATHGLGYWVNRSLKRFSVVLAVSPAALRFANQAFGLPRRGIASRVLPNVVDVPRFAAAKPPAGQSSSSSATPLIVFLGRLVPRKGCAFLLEALAKLHHQHPELPFRAVIGGKGPLAGQLQQLSRQLGLAERVQFSGFVPEDGKPGFLAAADIAVFPSTGGESFGIVLVEAMAAGRPLVLAGDNPGYRSVLEDRPELLFKPQHTQALADKLYHYLTIAHDSRAAVRWQGQHVAQFDIGRVGPALEAIYNDALSKSV